MSGRGVDEAGAGRAAASPAVRGPASVGAPSRVRAAWAALRRGAGLGDAVLLLYVLAVVRQYAWVVADNAAAWAATVLVSVAVWAVYVASKPDEGHEARTPAAFWPLVLLPLAAVYALRVALPDTSYDVLNYHIFQGERALHFPFYAPGDFFPAAAPFNPTPDIVQALTRRALGYRLGTIVNLLALVWAAQVSERLLRPFVAAARLRALAVLAVVLAEQLLFEINNYMVDLLPIPLILEATRLTLRLRDARPDGRDANAEHRPAHAARHESAGARPTSQSAHGVVNGARGDFNNVRDGFDDARGDLHAAHDDLHAAHDDLHAAHDDLRTAHDELHAAQDELHIAQKGLHAAQDEFHVAHEGLHAAHEGLHAAHEGLHDERGDLHAAHGKLHAARGGEHAAHDDEQGVRGHVHAAHGGGRGAGEGARGGDDGWRGDLLRVSLLLGLAVAFKVTNLAAVVALAPLWARRLFFARPRVAPARLASSLAAGAIVFLLPSLPYAVLMHRLTGSPLFPLFNGFFLSPYWGAHSQWDARFGPHALWEKLLWPLLLPLVPARLSELGIYSGRISLGFAASLAALLLARRSPLLRDLSVSFVVGALAWSFVVGYSRYGLHLELLGGVIVFALASRLAAADAPAPRGRRALNLALVAALGVALAAQLTVACYRILRTEWSLRPTVLREPAPHAADAPLLLRDHSLRGFLAPEDLAKVDRVEVWIECGLRTSAVSVMLRPQVPAVGVRNHEHFASPEAVGRYFAALDAARGRRMFSLCHTADAAGCAQALKERGLEIASKTLLRVPYYSRSTLFEFDLLEVRRGEPPPQLAAQTRQLPHGGYRARIVAPDAPRTLKAGAVVPLRVRVKNIGTAAWPAGRREGGAYQVNLGGRWLLADGETALREVGSRTTLPRDPRPGDELELTFQLDAPAEPGDYVLQLDMVHEAISWFYARGSEPLLLKIRVEP